MCGLSKLNLIKKGSPLLSKLNQILAVEKGVRSRFSNVLNNAYHMVQRAELFNGLSRTYRPKDDDGERLPEESKKVQVRAEDMLTELSQQWTRVLDVVATKDATNTVAFADVVVNGTTLLERVPVTYLLFLEKELTSLNTFIEKLPTLETGKDWSYDNGAQIHRTAVVETARSKKVPIPTVLYEATDKHPAQVQVFNEDVTQGYWMAQQLSGALPMARWKELRERVSQLQDAVKQARERANMTELQNVSVGDQLFGFILGD